MREILFRGKRVDNGEWIFGDLMQIPSYNIVRIFEQSNVARCETVNFNTVGQYTGLTDKNGTKIFEGDIIRIRGNEHTPYMKFINYLALIIFSDGGFCAIDGTSENFSVKRYNFCRYDFRVEVIGNIHDNPELLEGRQ